MNNINEMNELRPEPTRLGPHRTPVNSPHNNNQITHTQTSKQRGWRREKGMVWRVQTCCFSFPVVVRWQHQCQWQRGCLYIQGNIVR